jgi:hypothetical protein
MIPGGKEGEQGQILIVDGDDNVRVVDAPHWGNNGKLTPPQDIDTDVQIVT